jgi:hypothetical protein
MDQAVRGAFGGSGGSGISLGYNFTPPPISFTQLSWGGRNYTAANYPGGSISNPGRPSGMMNTQQMIAHIDRLRGGSFGGIAYGTAHSLGASPAVQDLAYGLGSAADGFALGRALGPRGVAMGPANRTAISLQVTRDQPSLFWPPNGGVVGVPLPTQIRPGTFIDRYGYETGSFFSPLGTSVPARSLAPGTTSGPYAVYQVVRPVPAMAGRAAPWFGQEGGGWQYETQKSAGALLREGRIRQVWPPRE